MQGKLKDGQPCDHKGCLSHTSHPCEGCGRFGGVSVNMQDRLQEIRDRVDKTKSKHWQSTQALDRYGEPTDAFRVYDIPVPYSSDTVCYVCSGNEDIDRNNAAFIAHSRQDVSVLLDYIAELESKLAEAIKHENSYNKASRAIDVMLSENMG